MSITKLSGNYVNNFDFDASYKWIYDTGLTPTDISREMGYNDSYISNSRGRGRFKTHAYKSLLVRYALPKDSFIKDDPEPVIEQAESAESADTNTSNVDLTELTQLVRDLIDSVNKLGNINMQMLTYIHEIKKGLE